MGEPLSQPVRQSVERDLAEGRPPQVSAISAWELGLLAAGARVNLTAPPARWFATAMQRSGFTLAALTPDLLIASCFLPGSLHRDPADRIICATARESGHTIVTRDRKILEYAAAGHCRALAC